MAVTRNKLIPVLGVIALAIVGTIAWKQVRQGEPARAGPLLTEVPSLPRAKGADADTPAETLATVVASNRELREQVQRVLEENQRLRQLKATAPARPVTEPAAAPANASTGRTGDQGVVAERGVVDVFSDAVDMAARVAGKVADDVQRTPGERSAQVAATPAMPAPPHATAGAAPPGGSQHGSASVPYKVVPPAGYAMATSKPRPDGVALRSYVRTSASATGPGGERAAVRAASAAAAPAKPQAVPYFTLPENATLAGVASMTSIIGRVPIDGKVTDPMQWKAVVGRDNLAASGFDLPDDIAGVIVTGIAIGDMALSCSEGKVRSLTFVFNDGAIRTVSTRRGANNENRINAGGAGASSNEDLGYLSDLHGNPCIVGTFVSNAPAYLTDIVGMKTLEVAGQAYADAQRTMTNSFLGNTTSAVTGSVGSYALGQAVAGASDEVSKWLMARLKNSFDAVVTPSGQRLVIHLAQEIRLDKSPTARRLVHRHQESSSSVARGERHGLE
jgi:integrating conjugative element protein (TIGR03752 family)